MKIAHVGWGYPPEWLGCGPVVYVHNVARAQAAAGHDRRDGVLASEAAS